MSRVNDLLSLYISSNCCYIDNREVLNKIIDQLVNRNTGKASTRELLGTTEHLDEHYCEASDNASPQRRSRDSNHLDDSSFSRKQKRYISTISYVLWQIARYRDFAGVIPLDEYQYP